MREQRRLLWQEGRDRRRQERKEADRDTVLLEGGGDEASRAAESRKTNQPQFYQIKAGEEFRSFNDVARKQKLQKYVFGNVLSVSCRRSAGLLCGTLFDTQTITQSALGFVHDA